VQRAGGLAHGECADPVERREHRAQPRVGPRDARDAPLAIFVADQPFALEAPKVFRRRVLVIDFILSLAWRRFRETPQNQYVV